MIDDPQAVLRDLARAKATFQLRAIATALTGSILDATPITRELRPRPLGQDGERLVYPPFMRPEDFR